jgi:uncharacterized protein YjbI with pentapeptide repeats
MPLDPLRPPPGKPKPLPAHHREHADREEKKSGWDKASVIVQAIGRFAIFVSLAGLFIGARKFGQQKTSAADLVDQQYQATLGRVGREEKKSGWDKASVIVQAIGGLAIFVSLAGLFIGVRQFNEQQRTNAADLVNQQHHATLDKYLDDMSNLVLNKQLITSGPNSPITAIAIARTATALRNLDGPSKGILVRFLWEAGLIFRPKPILDLYEVDLSGAVFQNANLYQAYLSPLGLTGANFNGAQLQGASLSQSVLIQSHLEHADLACWSRKVCTDLSGSYLMRADLTGTNLRGANLTDAELDGANLSGAILAGANLHRALYNTRSIKVKNAQGNWVTNMPTRWPRGFDPKAAGATCDDC